MANPSQVWGYAEGPPGLGTSYFSVFGGAAGADTQKQNIWFTTGVFRNLVFVLTAAVDPATTIVVTFRKNGAGTATTLTFNPGDLVKSFTASDLSISANDLVNIEYVNGGTGGGTPLWVIEFEPASGTRSCIGSSFHNGSGVTPLHFGLLSGFDQQGSAASRIYGIIPCNGTITATGVVLDANPGANTTFTVYRSTDQGLNFAIQDGTLGSVDTVFTMAARTGSKTYSLPVNSGDVVYIDYAKPGGGINVYGGVTMEFEPSTSGQFILSGITGVSQLSGVGIQYTSFCSKSSLLGVTTAASSISGIRTTTIGRFHVLLETVPGASTSYQFDSTLDESTTPVAGSPTITISGTGTPAYGTDLVNTVSLEDTHKLTLRIVPTNTPAASRMSWSAIGNAPLTPPTPSTDIPFFTTIGAKLVA